MCRIRTDIDESGADLYIDDDDDDSVSELFINRSRRDRFARVTKYSTLDSRTAKGRSFDFTNVESSAGDGPKRSMSVCSLTSVGSSMDSQAWSWADDEDFKNIAQIERIALHNDIRRCSFRSRNGTSNFVMNPLFHDETNGDLNESQK